MRILVTIALIVVAGLVTGAIAGKAIAGSGVPPQATGSESGGLRIEEVVGSTSLSAANDSIQVSPLSGTQASTATGTFPQSEEPRASNTWLTVSDDTTFLSPNGETLSSSGTTSPPASPQYVQASRRVPATLNVRLVAAGDVNVDGVVDFQDLFLINRALAGRPIPDGFVADLNGDKVINVLDLALVALKLGTILQ